MQMAKSLVIYPDSIVSMHTSSRAWENCLSLALSSNLALWANPLVQAKMDARNKVKIVYRLKLDLKISLVYLKKIVI